MSEDLTQVLRIEGQGNAEAIIRGVVDTLRALERQANRTGKALKASLGADLMKPLAAARVEAKAFGSNLAEAAERAARALRGDVAAVAELRTALRGAVAEQRAFADAARASQSAGSAAARSQATAARNAAQGRSQAAANDLRMVRQRWRVREASERAERREVEATGNAWAAAQRGRLSIMDKSAALEARRQREADRVEAGKARAESVATDRRVRDVARVWEMRERSEAAEARHLSAMRRERAAMRRSAMGAGRHAYGHAQHALRSVNHPAFESAGFWVTAGAAFGIEAGRHLLDAARSIDAATTRLRMMPGISVEDSVKVRADALREGMRIGLDPAEVVRLQTQAMKDGLSKDIAASLPVIVNAAVQTMGGTIERDGDELAKAVREASTVGWVRDAAGARSLMNSVAGLSTFNGNSPEKMQQFLASGGIGRGKELGWSKDQTLAFGAALNGSGERTGLGSARLMAQLPEIRAQMRDRYVKAIRSRENGEVTRATRAAPRLMGYGSITSMQQAFASPEGVTDFLSRLSKLPEQTRAAIEKGYGLGPQFNAVAAEMGADHGARYKQAFAREKQLSSQTADNDDLSKNSKIWSSSIDFMVGQLKASVAAVQSELGDVIKDEVLTPFTGWWVNISEALLNGGMKADLHRAIQDFIRGLGFDDLTAALNALRASIGTFDFAGFMRGVGQGVRAFMDQIRSLASVFGGTGGLSAESIGRLAAELFGLSVALHVVAPVLTIIGGIVSGFLALKAALEFSAWLSELSGLTAGIKALVGVETVAAASGLLAFAGALAAIGVAVQGLISAGVLNKIELPHDMSKESWDRFAWGRKPDGTSARPAWVDRLFGGGTDEDRSHLVTGPHGGLMYRQSYEGGEDPNNWRNLLTRASYEPSDSGAIMRSATVDTARTVNSVNAGIEESNTLLRQIILLGGAAGGGDAGGGGGGGRASNPTAPNIRYGRQHMGRGGSLGAGPGDTGGRASAMNGGESERAGRAMAKLMSLGWSKEAAAAAVGNAQQESGVRSDGPLGDTARFGFGDAAAHGMFQWRDQRFRDLKAFAAKKGTSWQDFDTQVEFFDQESKKYGSEKWRKTNNVYEANVGMKRFEGYGDETFGTRLANARQILAGKTGGGFYASQGQTVDVAPGGGAGGGAVDIALGMQGAGERQAQQILGKYMHPGEWCADFVNGALEKAGIKGSGSGMANSFSRWGHHVGIGDVRKGDVIEENAHGRGVNHAGLATGNVQRDRNGNVTAIEMVSGNYGHMVRKNWEKVGLIADLRRSDQAVAAAARKVGEAVARPAAPSKASDIAGKVHSGGRPRPGTGDAPAGSMTSADNSSMVNHFHIHGAHDPHHVARTVVAHLDRVNSRYTDGETVA